MPENVGSQSPSAPTKSRNADRWPELVVSNANRRRTINDAVRRGELRPIASRIYTSNRRAEPAAIVRRHWADIASSLFPNAIVSDRSGAAPGMLADGNLFLVHDAPDRDIALPGLTIRARRGKPPLPSDIQFGDRPLYRASDARLLVENLIPARRRSSIRRRLDQRELEEFLDRLARTAGEGRLREIANEIPRVAKDLELGPQGERALGLVREFLGTRSMDAQSAVLKARQRGEPYDPDRLDLFARLSTHLAAIQVPRLAADPRRQPEFPFFEAYFSNFIEGTEFEVDEAKRIVDTGELPPERPKDAYDILGTYQIVSNPDEMSRVPRTSDDLIDLLRSRHRILMAGRPEVRPGVFKTQNNRAGGTPFVDWRLVMGTIREGFQIGNVLALPFERSAYLMFLIAEIHPFDDGNGRLARIFMNAELFAAGEQRIIVPTNRRNDYLNGLRLLSRQRRPELLPRVMADLQNYAARIDWSAFDVAKRQLESDGAFTEPSSDGIGAALLDAPTPRAQANESRRGN